MVFIASTMQQGLALADTVSPTCTNGGGAGLRRR